LGTNYKGIERGYNDKDRQREIKPDRYKVIYIISHLSPAPLTLEKFCRPNNNYSSNYFRIFACFALIGAQTFGDC